MTAPAPIVHIYYSNMAHESRLLRAAKAAVEDGLASKAIGLGYQEGALPTEQAMADRVTFHRLEPARWFRGDGKIARLLRWPLWTIRVAREATRERPSVIQAHSLAAMPAGILAARLFGKAKLIYDAHELESERTGWSSTLKRIARVTEKQFIRAADAMIVVGPMISRWYAEQYNISPPAVVRNVPELSSDSTKRNVKGLRDQLGIPANDLLYVYVGVINHGRGIGELLSAFAHLPPTSHLALVGFGGLVGSVQAAAATAPNIHYVPPVASDEIVPLLRDADVGVSLIEDVSLSYRYCLPNKLFEYRHADLPVLVSNLPEMRAIIDEYGGGWAIENSGPAILEFVAQLSRDDIRLTLSQARPLFSWADERRLYLDLLEKVLP